MNDHAFSHRISWDRVPIAPVLQLKDGVNRRTVALEAAESASRAELEFSGEGIVLRGKWEEIDPRMSRLSFSLTNASDTSIRLTRMFIPAENGLSDYLKTFDARRISFLRNGYQSWSTARSYRRREKPLRPWLQVISLASSNLANLPSNVPGVFSSEMYTLITESDGGEAFLLGQAAPFDQFFYVKLNLYPGKTDETPVTAHSSERASHFELTFDFGRKMIESGRTVELDGILFVRAPQQEALDLYFERVRAEKGLSPTTRAFSGWCSWYYYYNKITDETIRENVRAISDRGLKIDYVQIDDGYQTYVGDWLTQRPPFEGKMKALADSIADAGYRPGLWLAPFVADGKSELVRTHPDYVLKSEHGRKLLGGFAVFWAGKTYYGLDITHPRYEEYLRKVIRTVVHDWGYTFLKCDFLFGACLRGATHFDIGLSRAEVLKYGMKVIREEAGEDVIILGCGMPLSTGIGTVDAMRVGPDTGPYWIERTWKLLRTGAMVGVRNSVRNTLVRSAMQKKLWVNDPDCVMLRTKKTKLTEHERMTQINAAILSGGFTLFSDRIDELPRTAIDESAVITRLSEQCFAGRTYALDLMEQETPEIVYNTGGFLGVFNMHNREHDRVVARSRFAELPVPAAVPSTAVDVWTGEEFPFGAEGLVIKKMPRHSSRLFRLS